MALVRFWPPHPFLAEDWEVLFLPGNFQDASWRAQ